MSYEKKSRRYIDRNSNSNSPSSRNRQDDGRTHHHKDNEDYKNTKIYEPVKKDFVNMRLTGLLAEETNMYKGVKIIYNEPAEAVISTEKWRLYSFKGDQSLPTIHLHRQSGFLIGKHRGICEIPMDHPSISKQHAVIQFRNMEDVVKPYLIDLNSTNGTFINGTKIEPQKYYELREQDILKFGFSTREYVLLTDKSVVSDSESDK